VDPGRRRRRHLAVVEQRLDELPVKRSRSEATSTGGGSVPSSTPS
jgi:hypothetical protein